MAEKNWRIIDTGILTAAENMAMDEALLEARTEFGTPPTLRFLRFDPPAVLVGYNQSVDQEIREDFCKENGIDINRRLTGGGGIFFDSTQVGWEIVGDKSDPKLPKALPDLYAKLCNCVVEGLKHFDLDAKFRPRNDIEVGGKKISGTGGTELYDAFLFQGTLLVDFDVELMLKTLRIPIEKLKRHEVESARERVVCLRDLLGYIPEYDEIKQALITGFSKELGVEFEETRLTEDETKLFEAKLDRFGSDDWINKVRSPPGGKQVLSSGIRTEGGIMRLSFILDQKAKWLEDVMITGDFFQHPLAIVQNLEAVFRDNALKSDEILEKVNKFFNENEFTLLGVTVEDFVELVSDVLRKLNYRDHGFTLDESKYLFEINRGLDHLIDNKHNVNVLTPYCAKQIGCDQRYDKLCDRCDECDVGTMHVLADNLDAHSEGICSFEDLMGTLKKLQRDGGSMFVGSCCEEFFIRHRRKMEEFGIPGVLVDIDSRTCYDLGKATDAYRGEFESQTYLRMSLITKVMDLIGEKK